MGFFNKLFGGRKEYPELDAESPAARRLREMSEPLETLVRDFDQPLEVVPAKDRAYVFIGKPPKQFGLAWVEGGGVKNFKNLVEEKGFTQARLASLADQLREAYVHSESQPRFETSIGGKEVLVTPSPLLEREVGEIIEEAVK